MKDETIEAKAEAVGLMVHWTDYAGEKRRVETRTLQRILETIEVPSSDPPPLVTAQTGERLDSASQRASRLILEDGTIIDDPIIFDVAGYHRLLRGDDQTIIAVAPDGAHQLDGRYWGVAVQAYGMRREGDGGIGDTSALVQLAEALAPRAAQAIALSPAHALYAGNLSHFSPYSPSSRIFLNPLLADPEIIFGPTKMARARLGLEAALTRCEEMSLIDWRQAGALKYVVLRRLFEGMDDPRGLADFAGFRRDGGERLERHAQFETLQTRQDVDETEIAFHIFLQWIADRCFAAAQARLKSLGMAIGFIADLAIGADPSGSDVWCAPGEYLTGLTIGAPPDLLAAHGQNWGLTALSPVAMRRGGFVAFLEILRAAMRHSGGVRIDHVLGLRRLWVVPEGSPPEQGAYLRLPFTDLARLVALESHRHRALIIGEDLGTVPEGFRDDIHRYGIRGMEVLWFQEKDDHFLPQRSWSKDAIAMTSTHDLPTLAGWWRGEDIAARRRCGVLNGVRAREERRLRGRSRKALWTALTAAGLVRGRMPGPANPRPTAEAALAFIADVRSRLMLLPMEDLLLLEDQPNLPGTIDQHPNWRRRYPIAATELGERPDVAARLDLLEHRRG